MAMNITTPPVGHWTRAECEKQVKRAKLPRATDETRLEWDVDLENSKRQRSPDPSAGPSPKEKETFPKVPIASDLTNLHPLLKATRAQHTRGVVQKKLGSAQREKTLENPHNHNSLAT